MNWTINSFLKSKSFGPECQAEFDFRKESTHLFGDNYLISKLDDYAHVNLRSNETILWANIVFIYTTCDQGIWKK